MQYPPRRDLPVAFRNYRDTFAVPAFTLYAGLPLS